MWELFEKEEDHVEENNLNARLGSIFNSMQILNFSADITNLNSNFPDSKAVTPLVVVQSLEQKNPDFDMDVGRLIIEKVSIHFDNTEFETTSIGELYKENDIKFQDDNNQVFIVGSTPKLYSSEEFDLNLSDLVKSDSTTKRFYQVYNPDEGAGKIAEIRPSGRVFYSELPAYLNEEIIRSGGNPKAWIESIVEDSKRMPKAHFGEITISAGIFSVTIRKDIFGRYYLGEGGALNPQEIQILFRSESISDLKRNFSSIAKVSIKDVNFTYNPFGYIYHNGELLDVNDSGNVREALINGSKDIYLGFYLGETESTSLDGKYTTKAQGFSLKPGFGAGMSYFIVAPEWLPKIPINIYEGSPAGVTIEQAENFNKALNDPIFKSRIDKKFLK